LKAVSKDFLVQPDLRYGSCTRPFWRYHVKLEFVPGPTGVT
jgi:hypothetical protein